MSHPDEAAIPFGIHASTGQALPGLSEETVRAMFGGAREPPPELIAQKQRTEATAAAFGVQFGVNANDLSQAGWGILFAPNIDPRIRAGLEPLIQHRRYQQATPLVIYDQDGYRPGETVWTWLKRRKVRLDTVDPSRGVPYYLLIVAPPEVIPFEFQYVLDLYWAVGRLWFDEVEDFQRYAESVVSYENPTRPVSTRRQLALFAPEHDFDPATQLFTRQVALPLRDGEGARVAPAREYSWIPRRTCCYLEVSALVQLCAGASQDNIF